MIIDFHAHPGYSRDLAGQRAEVAEILKEADYHGVQWICLCSIADWKYRPSARQVRRGNDNVLRLMAEHPDRILGLCYVNPCHPEAALTEIDRCVARGGMCGLKLWTACRASDPLVDLIAARAAELSAPILQHCSYAAQPDHISTPADVAALAARHPRTQVVMAHLALCHVRGLADVQPYPNVSVDIAGSEPEADTVEQAVAWLGPERVVFGTDTPIRSYGSSLGRVYGARLSAREKRMILGGNAQRLLARRIGG